eukprot:4418713-Prymnesium_polylepis.1
MSTRLVWRRSRRGSWSVEAEEEAAGGLRRRVGGGGGVKPPERRVLALECAAVPSGASHFPPCLQPNRIVSATLRPHLVLSGHWTVRLCGMGEAIGQVVVGGIACRSAGSAF